MTASAQVAGQGLPLHVKVLIGFALGALLGLSAHFWMPDAPLTAGLIKYVAQPAGQLFLSLLFMLVIPLMMSALILGVSELGDIASLGRLGWRTLIYTAALTAMAVAIGLIMVNLIRPGDGLDPAIVQQAMAASAQRAGEIADAGKHMDALQLLLGIVPKNVVAAMVDDKQKLGVMFFALMVGIGLVLTPTAATQAFKTAVQGLFEICMRLIGMIIKLAPYAVACLMFALCAQFGWDLLKTLGLFALTVIAAIAVHMFVVLPLWVRFMGGMSPLRFFRDSEEALLTAFATASSAGTLPITLRVAEENLKLPKKVSRFVLTIGAAANHHGTALFEGITVLFLAQVFGMHLGMGEQLMVLGLCILGGIGTAGIPAGSLPVIAMICGVIGLPAEGIGIILGVDRFLDMCRTSLNVTGDLATAVVVSRHSGDIDVPPALADGAGHGLPEER
ncbi:dicarboxylate/amino acid:cation symporter [Luteimonas gilva]|uniref:Dicarboxylate/amino acid:cation symporter n=1 Tax=Luteimonas gilva TaxID=2572684 RepID=A0A4V5ZPX4_9GAMM|nr:dicarboxylate/amino acid:cation symporter [Luteimonas gilva]TKR30753.1 dicarboxylate/amino acid:cation symporter [Luteimonas gilva]